MFRSPKYFEGSFIPRNTIEKLPNSLNSDIIKYGQCQYVLEIQIRNNLISAVVTGPFF